MINREFVDGMDYGAGYDSLSGKIRGDWVEITNPQPPIGGKGQEILFQLHQVNSTQELAENLEVSASANVTLASFAQASGKVGFLSQSKINKYSVYLLLRIVVKNPALRMRNISLTEQANKLLQTRGAEEFRKRAGDEFMIGLISGGEYIGLIEINTSSEEQKNEISADISLSKRFFVTAADFKADFQTSMSNISKKYEIRIFSYQIGGQETRQPQTIEEMITHAVNFPPNVREGYAKPLQAIFLDYGALEIPDQIDLIDVEEPKEIITNLWNRRLKYLEVLSDIEYVLQNPQQFESFDSHKLNQKVSNIKKQINNATKSAKQCASNYKSCHLSEDLIDLAFTLPERKPTEHLSPVEIDDLRSDRGIDYSRLRNLLASKNWKEADEETNSVMLKAVGRIEGAWLTKEEILSFPCTDLHTIDQLWVKYSNEHFGFSVQKQICLQVGGASNEWSLDIWLQCVSGIGWGDGNKEINPLLMSTLLNPILFSSTISHLLLKNYKPPRPDQIKALSNPQEFPKGYLPTQLDKYLKMSPIYIQAQALLISSTIFPLTKNDIYTKQIPNPLFPFFSRIQTCKL